MKFSFRYNNERKKLIENFFSLSVLQVLSYVFSLITLPYLAKTIGAENFGRIAFGAAVISYFQCVVQWGFRYSSVRDIAISRDDPVAVSKIASKVLCASLFLMIASSLVLLLLVCLVPSLYAEKEIILITALIIPGYTFFPDWLFQGMEKMKYITFMSFFSRLLFTISIFLFIKSPDDYVLEPAIQALGQFLPGILSLMYGIKIFNLKLKFVGFKEPICTLKEGFNVFFTQFMPTLYNQMSIVLLGSLVGQTAVGLFSAAYKFIGISEQFSAVLSRTFFPFLARRMDKHRMYALISGSISLLVSLVLLLGADIIINLFFTDEYTEAVFLLRILAFGPFFLFLRNTFGVNGLILIKKDKSYRNIVFICSVLGFVLALFSIPKWGSVGVAITFMVSWALMGLCSYFIFNKCNNEK